MATRGIRNNNPGNIIYSERNDWHGQAGHDGRFCIFVSPQYGIRAMVKILQKYQRRGVNTLCDIISTWAPSNENDTQSYINSICDKTGFMENFIMQPGDYTKLIEAIIYHENGSQPYPLSVIAEGIQRAAS